jgi:hypothetical protein
MLLGYFMRPKNRANIVREAFRDYMESCREHTKTIEQRALQVSPDQSSVLRNCFRLQHLLMERLTIRFEHLITTNTLDHSQLKSLDDIQKRLDEGWTEAEERAMKGYNAHYCNIAAEVEAIQSKWTPDSLTLPLRELMKDDMYRKQSTAHADSIRELQKRMAQ